MALSLQTIVNYVKTPFKLKLLAGKNGLNKNVSWVYYTEDADTIKFIRGGELAVTLGVSFEREKDNLKIDNLHDFLKKFIDNFITHNASGLIINTGKYIEEIPQSIIDFCDKNNFPLFSMPWEIHTIDLMQEVGNMISSDNQNSATIDKYFYKAIFEKENLDPLQIANTPFFDFKWLSIVIMKFDPSVFNYDNGKIMRYIQYSFNHKMNINQNEYCCFIHKQKIVYIIKDSNELFLNEIYKISRLDKNFTNSIISVSDYSDSIEELHELYKHANVANKINSSPDKINYYEDLGIYKIILGVKDKKILRKFYDDTLGKLNEMEPDKKEDFIRTLSLYLKTGGNVLKVSEQNNAHRNTILYRLSRIEELLDIDLSDGETRTALQVALYLRTIADDFYSS